MQTATSETERKSLDLSICVHHYTLRAPCPKSKPSNVKGLSLKSQLGLRRGAPSRAAYCRVLKWAICAIELLRTGLLFHR